MAAITVIRSGLLTTVQDLGRWGFQASGVPVSGALDPLSHRCANRLVGNPDAAATLEITIAGPHLLFGAAARVAVAGAAFVLSADGRPLEMGKTYDLAPETTLAFGERRSGTRAYLAVSGGIDVPLVLGSRSTHMVSKLGGFEGRPIRPGDVLMTGAAESRPARRMPPPSMPGGETTLRVIAGDARYAGRLAGEVFRVSPNSNRMGYRLEGTRVEGPGGEGISAAVPTGAIQIPPGGQPILLMNDHATTGGYAVAGVVITADLPRAGQLAPGDLVRFAFCTLEAADAARRDQEREFGIN